MPNSIPTVSLTVSRARLHHVPTHLVLCNNIVLPEERHSSDISLWIAWRGFGRSKEYLGAAWGKRSFEALDALVRSGLVKQADITSDVVVKEVDFVPSRDWPILCRFAEARGAKSKNLADLLG